MNDQTLTPLRIACIASSRDPDWAWIRDLMPPDFKVAGRPLEWHSFFTTADLINVSEPTRKLAHKVNAVSRYAGARDLKKAQAENPFDLIVSLGPWNIAWAASVLGSNLGKTKHLAHSFNFTDLPTGPRKFLMGRAFKAVDAISVFTDVERTLYANHFGIEESKFIRAPWGVAPPLVEPLPRQIEGDYYAALGGEARDYETLCEAARACPDIQFVAIARPHNFDGLNAPENLKVHFNLPPYEAWSMVWHSKATLVPLRSRETPCGLVTVVGAMHLGKAQVVTEAAGMIDYVTNEETGLLVPPRDAKALADAVKRLDNAPALTQRLGANAKTFATTNCTEDATVRFFEDVLRNWFG